MYIPIEYNTAGVYAMEVQVWVAADHAIASSQRSRELTQRVFSLYDTHLQRTYFLLLFISV